VPATAPGDNLALGALSVAAQTETRVRMRYRPQQGDETARDFDPYGFSRPTGFDALARKGLQLCRRPPPKPP
jgi:predicted DNA-binding transcriptional regulator YafY